MFVALARVSVVLDASHPHHDERLGPEVQGFASFVTEGKFREAKADCLRNPEQYTAYANIAARCK